VCMCVFVCMCVCTVEGCIGDVSPTALGRNRVFISYRISDALSAAEILKNALTARGIASFASHIDSTGSNIAEDIVTALVGCELFVVLGTKSYGEKTDIAFSTYHELEFACDERRPMFLIKMFEGEFIEPMTRFRLPRSLPYVIWEPLTALPFEVVDGICALLGDANV
jgi:hypothetical protein